MCAEPQMSARFVRGATKSVKVPSEKTLPTISAKKSRITASDLFLSRCIISPMQESGRAASQSQDIPSRGFFDLLNKCLKVEPEDNILVIYDEAFHRFLPPLQRLLIEQHLYAAFLNIPKQYQHAMISWSGGPDNVLEVSRCLESACGEANIILNCLDGDIATAAVRRAILERFRPHGCRFAHIPGLSEEILEILTRSPIEQIVKNAETLAWALGEAQSAVLVSYAPDGRRHELSMHLDGWENEPLMSPGLIFRDSWGNIPPGEVFCCPDPTRVNGTVHINGSVPGHRLEPQESGTITFRDGRVIRTDPADSRVAQFIAEQRQVAATRNDPNWDNFAELGIGLNPAVESLTGNPLLDEKALGTVHIAIGDNHAFGHNVKSYIHADMVTISPDLVLNGVNLIERGKLRLDIWQRLRTEQRHEPPQFDRRTKLTLRAPRLVLEDGFAKRKLWSGGRVGYVVMVDNAHAYPFQQIADELPEVTIKTYGQLKANILHRELDTALSMLHHYGILRSEH
jgi:hypothetical protein